MTDRLEVAPLDELLDLAEIRDPRRLERLMNRFINLLRPAAPTGYVDELWGNHHKAAPQGDGGNKS